MLDDCGATEFSCYATPGRPSGTETPLIDELAAQGLMFRTCWATPLCKPTRAALLSGKYAASNGVYGNSLSTASATFPSQHITLARLLQLNGYATAIAGKWHLPGSPEQAEWGWDEYSMLGGYLNSEGPNLEWNGLWFRWNECDRLYKERGTIGKKPQQYPSLFWNGCVVENARVLPSDEFTYAPALNQEFAIKFIENNTNSPFFLYYPTVLPHRPWFGTPKDGELRERPEPGFAAQLKLAEKYLVELIEVLKETGQYDNTLVFISGDNGTQNYGKGVASEIGVRVPMIVLGGPVEARGETKALIDYVDIYPTMMDYAGIPSTAASEIHGKSFKQVLEGKDASGKEVLFSYLDLQQMVRTKDYLLDGTGGIWKCHESGNFLDYTPIEDPATSAMKRKELLSLVKKYPVPDHSLFDKGRVSEAAKRLEKYPSHDYRSVQLQKIGNNWMKNPTRKKP